MANPTQAFGAVPVRTLCTTRPRPEIGEQCPVNGSLTHGPPALRFPEPIACYGSIPQAAFWPTCPEDLAPEFSDNPLWLSLFPCWPRGTSREGCSSRARAGC